MLDRKGTLLEELKIEIETYLEKHHNVSLQSVANRSGVSYNTLRRIVNKQSLPEMAQILKIVAVISDKNKIREIIDYFDNGIKEALLKAYSSISGPADDSYVFDKKMNDLFRDPVNSLVYTLCSNWNGCTEVELLKLVGISCKDSISILIQSDMIFAHNERYYAKESSFVPDAVNIKFNVSNYSKFLNQETLGSGYNYVNTFTESVTIDCLKEITDIQREASAKILKLIKDHKNKGQYPMFHVSCVDQFLDKDQL